jgi:hypothetical protein
MSSSLLVFTIIFYILSLVGSLVLMVVLKNSILEKLKRIQLLHFSLWAITLFFYLLKLEDSFHIAFLMSFCSGLLFSGIMIRSKQLNLVLKVYFASFILSVLVFLYSPSLLFYCINGSLSNYQAPQQFRLKENYFIVQQQSMLTLNDEAIKYKIIRKFGIYNKTLVRNVDFNSRLVNIKSLILSSDSIAVRGYLTSGDSMDLGFIPGVKKEKLTIKRK